jgi:hypothetical protein
MLANPSVLTKLNDIYKDKKIWMTHGQFIYVTGNYPNWHHEVSENDWLEIRSIPWSTTALRTFYTWLFKEIKVTDLQYKGEFIQVAGDLAIMFPIAEMTGKDRAIFIPDIMYIYRNNLPSNDHNIDLTKQLEMEKIIRSFPKYERLSSRVL